MGEIPSKGYYDIGEAVKQFGRIDTCYFPVICREDDDDGDECMESGIEYPDGKMHVSEFNAISESDPEEGQYFNLSIIDKIYTILITKCLSYASSTTTTTTTSN